MEKRLRTYLILIFLLVLIGFTNGQNSIFSQGVWIKTQVQKNTIIKLTYSQLVSAGLPVADIDPALIQVYGTGGGMLPQANDSAVFLDPQEIPIKVVKATDGIFREGDYLLFYAEGPDHIRYNRSSEMVEYQNHLYTEANYYFITLGEENGRRIKELAATPGPELNKGIKYVIHEVDLHNQLNSGRIWYGEKFDLVTSQNFSAEIDNLSPDGLVKLFSSVMAASTATSSFAISIDGITVGSQQLPSIPGLTYTRKGTTKQDWFVSPVTTFGSEINTVNYTFNKTSGLGYIDHFILQADVELIYNNDQLIFFTGNHAISENRTVNIRNCPEDALVWDITDPLNPFELPSDIAGGIGTFSISTDTENIAVFTANSASVPDEVVQIPNQDLKGISQADLLIISNPDFINVAEQIAEIRNSEGIKSIAVMDTQIYQEFSSGKKDITALRNYIKFLYDNSGLKYVLLLGKGTYDPKNILASDNEKLPIYQSRNSLFPLATYSSDDYLGFMEDHEGYWAEDGSNDHTVDLGIGRIPVTSLAEAERYLDKLYVYKSTAAVGNWRQKVVFVAENGDYNIHQRDAEKLATLIDTTYAAFTTRKIYVDDYPIVIRPGSRRAPTANQSIYETINSGALIVNYTGHGNEVQWANTRVFDTRMVDSLRNDSALPLFVTATCEFGRHDDTGAKSGAEDLLIGNSTGAIATITTSRPVFSSSNYDLNEAFYSSVFDQNADGFQKLGDIFKYTKNNSIKGVQNRNFILLGDPSMTLAYPVQTISLDSLNSELITQGDTLKPLEVLNFSGSIRNKGGAVETSFDGLTQIQVLDKKRRVQTIGQANGSEPDPNYQPTPFKYDLRDNILFSGSATVSNGRFSFTTILPKDISYNPESARIVIYAYRNDSTIDAGGANIDFLIGSSSDNSVIDNNPPEIEIYIGDTTFISGDIVNTSSLLVARLSDEYGINTSKSQIGHSITYKLDDQDPVTLNEYYSTEKDDFTTGWIYYDLPKLSPGNHTLIVTAWDTSNNSNSEQIEFTVLDNNQIEISNLRNYPNPMNDNTNFVFNHNLGGDEIEVTLEVLSTAGQKVYAETRHYSSAPGRIDNWQWDGRNSSGGKLISGVYIYGVFIRSMTSGGGQNQYSRLFISN